MELERRDTYVRLCNAVSDAHKVGYQLLVGSEGLVKRLATPPPAPEAEGPTPQPRESHG